MAYQRPSTFARFWQRLGPSGRLLFGTLIAVVFWWVGLRGLNLFGTEITWPLILLCAAIGWGRVGLAIRPMVALVALGLLQDTSASAPFGSHAIVALATYGFHAAVGGALDFDRDPILSSVRPFISLVLGFALLWFVASNAAGHAVALWPLFASGLATAVAYILLRSVFDLGERPVSAGGGV